MVTMKWDKIITTKQEYQRAFNRLSAIYDANSDSTAGMEAELLVTLIEKYEKQQSLSLCLNLSWLLKWLWK
jgi:HTH-type transcriptional regulator / antitoxin HigA